MNKRITYFSLLLFLVSLSGKLNSQPAGYYDSAAGLSGTALQQALHDIIDNHTSLTYTGLWTAFQTTDKKSDGKVWDMYSDKPGSTPAYIYTFVTDQCGTYSVEGDCYNREHSFPKSWFGGEVLPMYTDLFHLYPTDGKVNGMRDNYPFGTVSSATWTSTNGSKLGPSSVSGYSGVVFEPINAYKGDFARSYFYMATRYYGEDSSWPGSDMVTGSQPKAWAIKMLLAWDAADPISQKEIDRNNAVYAKQGNRNPFIDNSGYASLIWGSSTPVEEIISPKTRLKLYPNPAVNYLTIDLPEIFDNEYSVVISDQAGRPVLQRSVSGRPVMLDISALQDGYYILTVTDGRTRMSDRVIVAR